jgi:hypothetical protein
MPVRPGTGSLLGGRRGGPRRATAGGEEVAWGMVTPEAGA